MESSKNKIKPVINLIGQKYGKLTVFERDLPRFSQNGKRIKGAIWKCKCDCGNIKSARAYSLKSGHIVSCGCYKIGLCKDGMYRKEKGISGFNSLLNKYKRNAKLRNLDFLLSKSFFQNITSSNCYYCNNAPSQTSYCGGSKTQRGKDHSIYIYNGIDRIDSKFGYIETNVVPCCSICNYMKLDFSKTEFLEQIKKLYNNIFG